MIESGIVTGYVQSCVGGAIPFFECSSVWEFGVIMVLLAASITTLARMNSQQCLKAPQPIFWGHHFSAR